MKYRLLAALALLAAAAGSSVTLHDSNVSFKEALHSCSGALGSVSFSLGHARIAAPPGVESDESTGEMSMLSVVLEPANGDKSAKIAIDQTHRTVSAKHLRVTKNGAVACVSPD